MHPAINHELSKARAADLHRQAERDTLARAASRALRARTQQGSHPVPRLPSPGLARRIFTLLAAHSLPWPARAGSRPLRTYHRPAADKTSP